MLLLPAARPATRRDRYLLKSILSLGTWGDEEACYNATHPGIYATQWCAEQGVGGAWSHWYESCKDVCSRKGLGEGGEIEHGLPWAIGTRLRQVAESGGRTALQKDELGVGGSLGLSARRVGLGGAQGD